MYNYAVARENMIEGQIRPNNVIDHALINTMKKLPRENFVPEDKRPLAYSDEDIPLPGGRFLVEPMVLARMIQVADVHFRDVVLDIGCATGYSTAVLAGIANTVVAVEQDAALVKQAEENLKALDIDNAAVVKGDHNKGYSGQGPYDVILINGAVSEVPEELLNQLADGGRLVTVVENGKGRIEGHMGNVTLYRRMGDDFSSVRLFNAATLPLSGFEKPEIFEL